MGVGVRVGEAVTVDVFVGSAVFVAVLVAVDVRVGVAVLVDVAVAVGGTEVCVFVGVGVATWVEAEA